MAQLSGKALQDEVIRTKNVIAQRQAGGQDVSAQLNHYKGLTGATYNAQAEQYRKPSVSTTPTVTNTPVGNNTPAPSNTPVENPTNVNTTSTVSTPMQTFDDTLKRQADAQYAQQQAMLGQARDAQIAELQKAYANAIEQGQISVRQAQADFAQQAEMINQQAYQDAQGTNLTAESRGIGNSQQLLGLMAGDNSRKNGLINQNMTTRDRRIADISDRIKNITTQSNLDMANANATYNYGLASAKGQIDANRYNKLFDVQHEDYTANRDNQFDLNKMNIQQRYVLDQMAKQQGYDLAKMDKQQVQQLAQMAKAQGYDLEKMKQGNYYDMLLQNDAQAHDVGMFNRQSALDTQLANINAQALGSLGNPITDALREFNGAKGMTGLDQYYQDEMKKLGISSIDQKPVWVPPAPAQNQTLQPWDLMKMLGVSSKSGDFQKTPEGYDALARYKRMAELDPIKWGK